MKTLITIFAFLSSLLSVPPFLRPDDRSFTTVLWPFKLITGALAPVLGLIAGLGTATGLIRRDWKLAIIGILGAGSAARLVRSIPDSQPGFSAAFGPGWESRLPWSLQPHLSPRRWTPLVRATNNVTWERDIVYGQNPKTGAELLADIWQPPPGAQRTGLGAIYIHGGGWRIGDKDLGTRHFFRRLAGHGHVIMDIAYSLWPDADIPTMVSEVQQSVLWMKRHAAAYGFEPERIVLMGGSAGGHLALLTAYSVHHPAFPTSAGAGDLSVRGVVAFYPPTDLLALHALSEGHRREQAARGSSRLVDRMANAWFTRLFMLHREDVQPHAEGYEIKSAGFLPMILGGKAEDIPETYALLSPSTHVGPHCPPTLILQGSDDVFGLAAPVRDLSQNLQRSGVPVILVEFPHTDHGFDLILPQISPMAQAAIYDVERFLALLV